MKIRKNTFRLANNWKLILHELGLRQADILRQAYLPPDLFTMQHPILTDKKYFRLFDVMYRHLTHSPLGVEYARKVPIEAFPPAILAAMSSTNFNTAMQQIVKYRRLICPLRINVDTGNIGTIVTIEKLEGGAPPHAISMVLLALLVRILRISTKKALSPLWVSVAEKPTQESEYVKFFKAPLRHNHRYAFALSPNVASTPFVTANAQLVHLLEPSLKQRLFNIDRHVSMSERVRDIIHERIVHGSLSIEDVAQRLERSVRSLQRDLHRENTSFKQILDSTRKEMAYYYLADTDLSVAEIAHLIGFVDSASFFRVFKSWTGQTPRRYRVEMQ